MCSDKCRLLFKQETDVYQISFCNPSFYCFILFLQRNIFITVIVVIINNHS